MTPADGRHARGWRSRRSTRMLDAALAGGYALAAVNVTLVADAQRRPARVRRRRRRRHRPDHHGRRRLPGRRRRAGRRRARARGARARGRGRPRRARRPPHRPLPAGAGRRVPAPAAARLARARRPRRAAAVQLAHVRRLDAAAGGEPRGSRPGCSTSATRSAPCSRSSAASSAGGGRHRRRRRRRAALHDDRGPAARRRRARDRRARPLPAGRHVRQRPRRLRARPRALRPAILREGQEALEPPAAPLRLRVPRVERHAGGRAGGGGVVRRREGERRHRRAVRVHARGRRPRAHALRRASCASTAAWATRPPTTRAPGGSRARRRWPRASRRRAASSARRSGASPSAQVDVPSGLARRQTRRSGHCPACRSEPAWTA